MLGDKINATCDVSHWHVFHYPLAIVCVTWGGADECSPLFTRGAHSHCPAKPIFMFEEKTECLAKQKTRNRHFTHGQTLMILPKEPLMTCTLSTVVHLSLEKKTTEPPYQMQGHDTGDMRKGFLEDLTFPHSLDVKRF
jgi:hypothetical protein